MSTPWETSYSPLQVSPIIHNQYQPYHPNPMSVFSPPPHISLIAPPHIGLKTPNQCKPSHSQPVVSLSIPQPMSAFQSLPMSTPFSYTASSQTRNLTKSLTHLSEIVSVCLELG
ncbi:hypothetical protein CHS0354_011874 [Potamilus streckersoni]|uniref:Uncharacterized protein n=1 Tax=Potamilus streckersoni TaxID=2493646 RepID=A0AAE0T5Z6_9BIVA|nr:hypothetical protein CHS0354_011874 [Potamilus streckersoni]